MIPLRPGAVWLLAFLLGALGLAALLRWQAPAAAGQSLPAAAAQSDLNRALTREVAQVPGIGLARAAKIIALRTRLHGFTNWEKLRAVPGIGPRKLERLRREFEITSPPRPAKRP